MSESKRIQRENKTVSAMIRLYCKHHHNKMHLCEKCEQLLTYTQKRNDVCPFGDEKPVCSQCKVHCYSAKQREKVKQVMRYAGPRMLLYHPILAIRHIIDSKIYKAPTLKKKRTQIKR